VPRKPPKKTAASRKVPRHTLPRKTRVRAKTSSAKPTVCSRQITAPVEAVVAEQVIHGVGFPEVGVGASAGGLEAFTHLLQRLHTDTGMAFVLIQHLHPEYESALTEILSRVASMPVTEALDGMTIEPNHSHSAECVSRHAAWRAAPATTHDLPGQKLPIDHFFRSLAEDQGSKAIGVILSGTTSDGVLGLKAIKGEGGIPFTQDEKSAKYDGVPHSAITAGCVDFSCRRTRLPPSWHTPGPTGSGIAYPRTKSSPPTKKILTRSFC